MLEVSLIRSRNGAPSRKGRVVNGLMTKASKIIYISRHTDLVAGLGAKGDKVPEHVRVLEVGLGVPLLRVDKTVKKKTRRNTKRNETKRSETKRNEMKRRETKRNEMKRSEAK